MARVRLVVEYPRVKIKTASLSKVVRRNRDSPGLKIAQKYFVAIFAAVRLAKRAGAPRPPIASFIFASARHFPASSRNFGLGNILPPLSEPSPFIARLS